MSAFALLVAAALISPNVSMGAGWERSLHVEWGYTPPSDLTISEFRLYQEGAKVCIWTGATVRAGDCKVTLQKSGTAFTLDAGFTNGGSSPKSAPFTFSDFGNGPAIMILIGK